MRFPTHNGTGQRSGQITMNSLFPGISRRYSGFPRTLPGRNLSVNFPDLNLSLPSNKLHWFWVKTHRKLKISTRDSKIFEEALPWIFVLKWFFQGKMVSTREKMNGSEPFKQPAGLGAKKKQLLVASSELSTFWLLGTWPTDFSLEIQCGQRVSANPMSRVWPW